MTVFLQYLRCNIIWSTTNSLLDLTLRFYSRRETKVTNLRLHLIIDENVTQLKVSVNDSLLVDINQRLDNLAYVHSRLMLSESLPPLNQILKGVIPTILQQDINVLFILKGINKLDNMFVFKSFMNFYLY